MRLKLSEVAVIRVHVSRRRCISVAWSFILAGITIAGLAGSVSRAQAQDWLDDSPAAVSPNAALHYHRAILSMASVDPELRGILMLPIWEEVGKMKDQELAERLPRLTFEARQALSAAVLGSQQNTADFGLDYADHGLGGMPHVGSMLRLGRLVTLAGWDAQRRGDWKDAAKYYLASLRMGRHMTQQPTLSEAVAGIEIIENNYYALADWTVRCTEPDLVRRVAKAVSLFADEPLSPAKTLLSEARMIALRCARLKDAFPDGPWAEMLLEAVGKYPDSPEATTREALQKAALAVLAERGIPGDVLDDKAKFDAHVDRLCGMWTECFDATAESMRYPAVARAHRCQQIYHEYREKLSRLGDADMLDPSLIGSYYSIHDAERTMLRVVMALAAARNQGRFPKSLDEVAPKFGGSVPRSPYDHSALEYSVSEDGRDFTLVVSAVQMGETKLPEVKFSTKK